jgi:arabinogalactan endo-1,4-beta-galactosidase
MIKTSQLLLFIALSALLNLVNCSGSDSGTDPGDTPMAPLGFYFGADLSYVNEMEDCGAVYRNRQNQPEDPYAIFKNEGANLLRLRLWHNPNWTNYSNFEDVKRSIRRAKEQRMRVLLDFHYSDTWADPSQQQIPEAWKSEIDKLDNLGQLLYDYTYQTLEDLHKLDLTPDIVQIGNEINPMILQDGELEWPIDWNRNSHLLNQGIKAVRDLNSELGLKVEIMLHIAQPENGLWWFEQATAAGVTDYDWIGLSYYPKWSEYDLSNVGPVLSNLMSSYNKKLMIVETAYPFTLESWDDAGNILGSDALIPGYAASIEGQLQYMKDLKEVIEVAGGSGLIYWEPAWVSTNCSTQWGQGSHWENATMFDRDNRAHEGISFFNEARRD